MGLLKELIGLLFLTEKSIRTKAEHYRRVREERAETFNTRPDTRDGHGTEGTARQAKHRAK